MSTTTENQQPVGTSSSLRGVVDNCLPPDLLRPGRESMWLPTASPTHRSNMVAWE